MRILIVFLCLFVVTPTSFAFEKNDAKGEFIARSIGQNLMIAGYFCDKKMDEELLEQVENWMLINFETKDAQKYLLAMVDSLEVWNKWAFKVSALSIVNDSDSLDEEALDPTPNCEEVLKTHDALLRMLKE